MPPPRRLAAGFIIAWIAGGVVGVIVLLFAFVACVAVVTPTSSPSRTVGPQYNAAAGQTHGTADTFGDGTYQVGTDIMPGRYRTSGSGKSGIMGSCYWAILANDTGSFEAIVGNDNFNGPASVSMSSGQFLKVNGGCVWTRA